MSDYIIRANSWTILDENTFVKQGDKSFFEFNTTGVPKTLKKYWKADKLIHGESIALSFCFQGMTYKARIEIDPLNRSRILWKSDLGDAFKKYYDPKSSLYPLIRFQRISNDSYEIIIDSESIDEKSFLKDESDWYADGKRIIVTTIQHERNRKNREAAIRIHGTKCMICDFDFESFYGEVGKGYIEVHHLHPLSEQDDASLIDPKTDLICICSNCHRIVHRKKDGIYTVEEVKEMIANNGKR